jgi:hypothetical protein
MSDTQESQSDRTRDVAEEPKRIEPSAQPDDIAPPLAILIASLRAALTRGASAEVRAAGTIACRSLLAVLEAKPGQPLATAVPAAAPTSSASAIASLLSQPGFLHRLAAMSRDELVTLLKQITGAMPVRPATPATAGPRFHLIEIPQLRKPDGSR